MLGDTDSSPKSVGPSNGRDTPLGSQSGGFQTEPGSPGENGPSTHRGISSDGPVSGGAPGKKQVRRRNRGIQGVLRNDANLCGNHKGQIQHGPPNGGNNSGRNPPCP
eukprot:1757187-Heterocapsa_arctica.AAC.1